MTRPKKPVVPPIPEKRKIPDYGLLKPGLNQQDSLFCAGVGLATITPLIAAGPAFLGCLVERLSLAAAEGVMRAQGRPEREDSIRDEWMFRTDGAQLSPAAAVHAAYMQLNRTGFGRPGLGLELMRRLQHYLREDPELDIEDVAMAVTRVLNDEANSVIAAARSATVAMRRGTSEAFAVIIADIVLSIRLGLPVVLPMLSAHIGEAKLRDGGNARRAIPFDTNWDHAVCGAYALAAQDVLTSYVILERRAITLMTALDKVRTREKAKAESIILGHDCIKTTTTIGGMSKRATLRLCERLNELGALRELTGRNVSRLYGL
jgi:hypothetical protein